MGEVKQHRSEEKRRNYEKQERKRQQAIRRKAFKASWREKWNRVKTWVKQHPGKTVGYIAIAVAAVMLIHALVYLLLPVKPLLVGFDGKVIGREKNWLILNAADRGDDPRYYHLADFDIPAGFKQDDYGAYDEVGHQDFYCTAEGENDLVQDLYVSAAKNMDGATYVERLLSMSTTLNEGTPKAATIAGKDCHYVYLIFDESDTAGAGMAFSSLCVYFDTLQGSAVSAMINSPNRPQSEVPTEEQLLAEAEVLLAGLTICE